MFKRVECSIFTLILSISFTPIVTGRIAFPSRVCVTWIQGNDCVGEDRALTDTGVRLHYDYTESGMTKSEVGPIFTESNEIKKVYNLTYSSVGGSSVHNMTRQAEYYFEQLEHGGGDCNCVDIYIDCLDDK